MPSFLAAMHRVDESVAEATRALEVDPLSLPVNNVVGGMLSLAGRYDEAIEQYRKTLELDANVMRAHILTANGLSLWGASINNHRYNRVGGVWSTRTGTVAQIVQTVRRDAGVGGQPPQTLATLAPDFGSGRRFRQVFAGRMNGHGEIYFDADVADEADPENLNPEAGIFHLAPGSSHANGFTTSSLSKRRPGRSSSVSRREQPEMRAARVEDAELAQHLATD